MTTLNTALKTASETVVIPLTTGLLFSGPAKLFAICNPTAAFVYGAASSFSAIAVTAILNKANIRTDTTAYKALMFVLPIISGLLATTLLTGYQFTVGTLIVLHLGAIPFIVGGLLVIVPAVIAVKMCLNRDAIDSLIDDDAARIESNPRSNA